LQDRRLAFAITVARLALALGIASSIVVSSSVARAQGAARDSAGLSTSAEETSQSWLQKRFAGSTAELSTYVGSGTFYASGYHDSYVSNALYLRPSYQLGTKYKLSLNARVYLEEEYTTPDTPNGRRFYPLDTWFYLAAKNLYTEARSKIRFSGTARMVVPTSYESRYAHLVTSFGVSGAASRGWELGTPDSQGKRWEVSLTLGEVFTKAIRTSSLRGNGPGDSTGCRGYIVGPATGTMGSSESDRCGGPLSTSFSNNVSLAASVSRRRFSFSATFILINEFRYRAPDDAFTSMNAVPQGRSDSTWSILALGYDVTEHVGVSLGMSTFQPALNSRADGLRFPFFDFSGGNANNFTQAFLGVNGTL
jgi:hypothetical protein